MDPRAGHADLSGAGRNRHAEELSRAIRLGARSYALRSPERARIPVLQPAAKPAETAGLRWQRAVGVFKGLSKGRFSWPHADEKQEKITLRHEELSLLLNGIDLTHTTRKKWHRVVTTEQQISA